MHPRRTPGGYRLYTPSDVARLRTILRMQRDEFLPLRVIRQELASGRQQDDGAELPGRQPTAQRIRGPRVSVRGEAPAAYSLEDVLEDTRAPAELVKELRDFGIIEGQARGGTTFYDETERELGGRNLRVFRSSADRESSLLQAILAPALRSRNPERRKEALEALENLAAVASHLKHLLLVRDLRRVAR